MNTINVTKKSTEKAGSCNFCTNKNEEVYVIRSNDENRNLEITMCEDCMKQLRLVEKSVVVVSSDGNKNTDVHTQHCCKRCGCKYNDDDCTVVTGAKKQSFECGINEVCL